MPSAGSAGGTPAPLIKALVALAHQVRERVPPGLGPDDDAAQAVACAIPIVAVHREEVERATPWLLSQLSDWEQWALNEALSLPLSPSPSLPISPSSSFHLFEPFLHAWHQGHRKRSGVFFTPQPIADFIVAGIDRTLRQDFALTSGITTDSAIRNLQSAVHFLDPALGTGVFLLTVLDRIHHQLTEEWTHAGHDQREQRRRWNDYVPRLLPRLTGIEILPAAALLAKLNLAIKLAQTGYDFADPAPLNIICGDALLPNPQSVIRNPKSEIPILLGNPPYSALSTSANPWIGRLVRGDDEIRGYVRAGDERLGERKTWLHDDYVKFLRLAQWHIEEAGCGVVGMVTNHGYLDNTTFRLMRSELMRVFTRIHIVDLHGNRKKREIAPGGRRDENVFGLDQGVAISIFSRPPKPARHASEESGCVEHTELWGTREEKLATLNRSVGEGNTRKDKTPTLTLRVSVLNPRAPDWRFVPHLGKSHPEYDAGWLLTDLMPVNTSAPVTARDHFVVSFTRAELHTRIEQFCDLSIPDDEIRNRWFTRTRSARYQPGDTRGWKLSEARRIVAADADWRSHVVRCLYRPFDWRYVFWHPAMIDWQRTEVTRHLISSSLPLHLSPSPRLCLLTRRQQLPTQPCTYFWVADGLALDGVIRSDNRGSESLFPLWLYDDDEQCKIQRRSNFAPEIVRELEQRLSQQVSPEALFGYIYALFHSPTYRERYAEELRSGFPRVLPPKSADMLAEMNGLGWDLVRLHCLNSTEGVPEAGLPPAVEKVDDVESFRVGGYEVLHKWLQPKHRGQSDPEYRQIAAAIAKTLTVLPRIETVLSRHALW